MHNIPQTTIFNQRKRATINPFIRVTQYSHLSFYFVCIEDILSLQITEDIILFYF